MNKKPKRERKAKFVEVSKEYKSGFIWSILFMVMGIVVPFLVGTISMGFLGGFLFGIGLFSLSYWSDRYDKSEIVYEVRL